MSRGNPAKPPGMVYIFIGVVNDAVAWEMVRGLNAWTQLKCSGIRRVYRDGRGSTYCPCGLVYCNEILGKINARYTNQLS